MYYPTDHQLVMLQKLGPRPQQQSLPHSASFSDGIFNPLYGDVPAGPGAVPPSGTRASKYRELLPDNSPFTLLRQQALSSAGSPLGHPHLIPAAPSQPVFHSPSFHQHPLGLSPSAPSLDHLTPWQPQMKSPHDLVPLPRFPPHTDNNAGAPMHTYQPTPAYPAPQQGSSVARSAPQGTQQAQAGHVRINPQPAVHVLPPSPSASRAASLPSVQMADMRAPREAPVGSVGQQPAQGPTQQQPATDQFMSPSEYQAKVAAVTMDSLTAVTKHPLSAHTPTTVSQPATQPHPQGPPQGSNPAGLSHQPNQGLNQAGLSPQEVQALHQQISKRMGELYTYFKGVHDKDQAKLRKVSAALQESEDRVSKLRARNRQLAKAAGSPNDGSPDSDDDSTNKAGRSGSGGYKGVTNVVFLPYQLHPAEKSVRFFSVIWASWHAKRTTWLALFWLILFLLAVTLLIALLVPWHKAPKPPTFAQPPVLVAVSATSIDLQIRLDSAADVYYAAIPTALLSASLTKRLLFSHTPHSTPTHSATHAWDPTQTQHYNPVLSSQQRTGPRRAIRSLQQRHSQHTLTASRDPHLQEGSSVSHSIKTRSLLDGRRGISAYGRRVLDTSGAGGSAGSGYSGTPTQREHASMPVYQQSVAQPPWPPTPSPPPQPPASTTLSPTSTNVPTGAAALPPPAAVVAASPPPPPPAAVLAALGASDVVAVAVGDVGATLQRYATACGTVTVATEPQYIYNLSIMSVNTTAVLECTTTLSAPAGRMGPGAPGQCARCATVRPLLEPYTIVLVAVRTGGDLSSTVQVVELGTPVGNQVTVRVNGANSQIQYVG